MTQRQFDVVVFGASGFTGRLVAEYLAQRYGVGAELRWAIAGRSEEKLRAIRESLGAAAASLELLQADSHDVEALRGLAASTRVVATTVGPYALYGSELVEACIDSGTHYCDLAGESQWIRGNVDRLHDRAQASGARIVHCCGFDSIPSDLGVLYLQTESRRLHGEFCQRISLFVRALRGAASGGTYASLVNVIRESREDPAVARIVADPYALNPAGERRGPDRRDQRDVRFRDEVGSWTAPFVMAGINTRVVRRSHALLGHPWGADFRYDESTLTGAGLGGRLKGAAVALALGGLVTAASFAPTRRLLQRFVLTAPGDGPDREARESGFFKLLLVGRLADDRTVTAQVTGDRDPGYGSTSKMLGESAVCLALDSLDSDGGVLTPASAMGLPLLRRLQQNAGLGFALVDQSSGE